MHVISFKMVGSFAQARTITERLQEDCASCGIVPGNDEHTAWTLSWQFPNIPDLANIAETLETNISNLSMNELPDQDWLQQVYESTQRIETDMFLILHPDADKDNPENKHLIYLDSPHAFGTGGHPTTMGCIKLLEQLYQSNVHPKTILDIGCGSGVLGFIAATLWPDIHVTALDIEQDSVHTTTMLWDANGFDEERLTAMQSNGVEALDTHTNHYDLIIANILPVVLDPIADNVTRCLAPQGSLVMSGILNEAQQSIIHRYQAAGLTLIQDTQIDEWMSLVFKR